MSETEKINFGGLITMFSVMEIPNERIKNIIYIVGKTVSGYNADNTKRKPVAVNFEHAINSLMVNNNNVNNAIKGITGRMEWVL